MSKTNDKTELTDDDLFVQQAKAVFDQSVDGLDGQTLSRLTRNRHEAIASIDSGSLSLGRWTQWAPAASAAAVAIIAVSFWNGDPQTDAPVVSPMIDMDLILADESFDMLQDLEFYSWLDIDAEMEGEAATDTDVG